MPPFGTAAPSDAISTTSGGAMESRSIHSDPRELWYLNLPSKLTPAQVLQILRSALGGDIWQQWQLSSIMLDSWPMLRKCSHELREAVSQSKFKVEAFAVNGEEPTATASEKSALVRRAFSNFKPNQFTDEEDLSGGIYDFCDSMLNGLTVSEILWQTVKTKSNGTEKYPRALCWVHPRHFTFTNDGMVAIYDSKYARTYYNLTEGSAAQPDPRKFVCCQFKSRSGSALGAGLIRPIAYDWSAVMFNREWLLKSAQTFGSPFVDVTYKPGTQAAELAKLDQEIAAGLANRFIRHVEGTTVNVAPGQRAGQGNSQQALMELADKHVCELFLGSEGTTKMTPGKLGGSQNGSPQESTKRERVEGLAKWVAAEPLQQLARAILLVNYGEDSECPTIEADFTEIQDPMEAATRMQIICGAGMPPIIADEYYAAMKLTKPEPDDQVISGGKIGLLGDTEQEIDPNPQQPETPPVATDENGNPLPAQKINPNDAELQMKMAQSASVKSGHRGTDLKVLLGKASDADIQELNTLVHAAEQADHFNGEHSAVKAKLAEIAKKVKA